MRDRRQAAAAAAFLTLLAASARGDEKKACVQAYEQAQVLRKAHDLKGAHEQLVLCARDVCPAVLKTDCVPWLAEVTEATPSIVIETRDPLGATVEATVYLDDKLVPSSVVGSPIEVNPGVHVIRVEAVELSPIEARVEVSEGDKRHRVPVTVGVAPPAPPLPSHAPLPVAAIAFGAVGVVGISMFATFGLLGNGQKSDLDASGCKPTCSASDVSAIKRDYVVADVALGVGVASLVLATYFFVTRTKGDRGQAVYRDGTVGVAF